MPQLEFGQCKVNVDRQAAVQECDRHVGKVPYPSLRKHGPRVGMKEALVRAHLLKTARNETQLKRHRKARSTNGMVPR
jgi:hypothetical protein